MAHMYVCILAAGSLLIGLCLRNPSVCLIKPKDHCTAKKYPMTDPGCQNRGARRHRHEVLLVSLFDQPAKGTFKQAKNGKNTHIHTQVFEAAAHVCLVF